MEIKKTIYNTPLLFFIIFCAFTELLINGSLFGIATVLSHYHHDILSSLVTSLFPLTIGAVTFSLFHYREEIKKLHLKKEKTYKFKNIFNLTNKEKMNGVDFTKVEKEMDS